MRAALIPLCALAAVAVAVATPPPAPIPTFPVRTVWEDMFPPPYVLNPQMSLAMVCVSEDKCYIGGGSNGVGFGVFVYDGKMNGEFTQMNEPNMSMIVTDLAITQVGTTRKGAFSSITMMGESVALQYLSGATGAALGTWLPSAMPKEFIWASTAIAANADGSTVLALGEGPFTGNNIMASADGGKTFAPKAINYVPSNDPGNCTFPGYLAMPAHNAWYMTWGAEPAQNNNNGPTPPPGPPAGDEKYVKGAHEKIVAKKNQGQVLVILDTKSGKARTHVKTVREMFADRRAVAKAAPQCNFYRGAILKSTDQGVTWTEQASFPNDLAAQIVCKDASHCAVVAFNAAESKAIVTQDGATWTTTLVTEATETTFMAIQAFSYASGNTLWAAGGKQESAGGGAAVFWQSEDNGQHWTQYPHEIPDVMALMSVSFTSTGVGFALGISMFKTTTVLRYKSQTDYPFFTQKQCPVAGCTFLCQNAVFPQGMCLQAGGGSAKAYCTPAGLVQRAYNTTSCVGGFETFTQPVNVCINGTNGFFENVCP